MYPVHFLLVLQQGKHSFTELSELPLRGSADILNCNLIYVNKLREYWHRGKNAIVIDDLVDFSLILSSFCSVYMSAIPLIS